ncbi:MAG: sigma-70 family RNA polymerase sigma factor, partial [Holophagales bacterium]|nr:sigma-70 family RNA polymerase sigma factor [Holophagales bacterium]
MGEQLEQPGAGPSGPDPGERVRAGPQAAGARQAVERAVRLARETGDREVAFRQVFEAYFGPLQRFFRRKGFSREEALDLTQETLLGIYKGWSTYRGESSFRVWMYQVARRIFLKRLR